MKPVFNYILKFSLSFLLLSISVLSFGQKSQFGIGIGANNYWGDLSPDSFGKNVFSLDIGSHLVYKQRIIDHLNIRFNLHLGKVSGSDAKNDNINKQQRNLNFYSVVREFSVGLEYSFWDIERSDRAFAPFIGAGVGVFSFNPKTDYTFADGRTIRVDLQPLGTEGQGLAGNPDPYALTAITIPLNGGVLFRINDQFSMSLEIILRYSTTDYLDDVSTKYIPIEDFPTTAEGILAGYLSNRTDEYFNLPENDPSILLPSNIRGSENARDLFHSGMLTIFYKFSSGLFGRKSGVDCYSF